MISSEAFVIRTTSRLPFLVERKLWIPPVTRVHLRLNHDRPVHPQLQPDSE